MGSRREWPNVAAGTGVVIAAIGLVPLTIFDP